MGKSILFHIQSLEIWLDKFTAFFLLDCVISHQMDLETKLSEFRQIATSSDGALDVLWILCLWVSETCKKIIEMSPSLVI